MRSEKLKYLLYSYVECRQQRQDDCDGLGNYSDEIDDPVSHCQFSGQFVSESDFPPITSLQFNPFGQYVHEGGLSPISPLYASPFGVGQGGLPQQTTNVGRNLAQLAAKYSTAHPDKSIIKFEEIYMVKEPREQIVSIPVVRLQHFANNITKVSWKTCDKTALANTHYVGSSGEIIFNEGDTHKAIEIKILDSSSGTDDLRFIVELTHTGGMFNPTPLTISLKRINNFYPDEIQVLNNLPRSLPISIADITSALGDCMNNRTFHVGLTCICSTNNAIDVQFALACELSSWCLRSLSSESILNVLLDFFRLDDIDY